MQLNFQVVQLTYSQENLLNGTIFVQDFVVRRLYNMKILLYNLRTPQKSGELYDICTSFELYEGCTTYENKRIVRYLANGPTKDA